MTTLSLYCDTDAFPSATSRGRGRLLLSLVLGMAVIWIVLSSGCATVGRDFPVDRVSDIRLGETTQSEIREMFGAPWRVGIEDGQRTWTYGKYRYSPFGESRTQDLVIRFDQNDVVTSYTFNTTEHEE